MTRVTVIMPVYNGERFIAEAIDSVLAQTLRDWEMIVVDDGSADGTPSILKTYSDPRIRVIRQENQGEGAARNTGLDVAQGEYVAFLDADDEYLPTGLQSLVEHLDAHPEYGATVSDGYFIDVEGRRSVRLSDMRSGVFIGDILEPLVLSAIVVGPPVSTLTRRAAIEICGIRFDPSIGYSVDWDFWLSLARCVEFGYLDRATCLYRVHHTNMSGTLGRRGRRLGIMRNRQKVLMSPWFCALSQQARSAFFYDMLVNLLHEDTVRQEEVMSTPAFTQLPAGERARLHRLVASSYLLRGRETDFARAQLGRAVELNPSDRRGRLLAWLVGRSPLACRAILGLWQAVHVARSWLRSLPRWRVNAALRRLAP